MVKHMHAGDTIGYGATYTAKDDEIMLPYQLDTQMASSALIKVEKYMLMVNMLRL